MTKMFASFFAALTAIFTGTEELAHGYSAVCRTGRKHAEAFEKESSLELDAKLRDYERKLNAIEHQA